MKKTLIFLVILSLSFNLFSCAFQSNSTNEKSICSHSFMDATCTKAAECKYCGEKRGDAKGHNYTPPTCEEAYICKSCNDTSGEANGHDFSEATCISPKICTVCGDTSGYALGHDYFGEKYCSRCGANNPDFYNYKELFSEKPSELYFEMNSAGGISFVWRHKYTGTKKINYITVTYTLYDRVGTPTQDDIYNKSTNSVRLIGPFEPGKKIEFYSDVFVYCDVAYKVSFDSLYLEYADGTTATVDYGWYNTIYY